MSQSVEKVEELQQIAKELRRDVIYMVSRAKSGHVGGSLSAAEIVTALYFSEMKLDPAQPKWPDRDRFILSKGHCCPILYAALCRKGYFSREVLDTLRKVHSPLQGHPDMRKTPGLDMSSGSLGNGLSIGLGMALAARANEKNYRVYVLMGDGEQEEGAVWEAAMAASHMKVDNLVGFVDCNKLQLIGRVAEIIDIAPLADKWRAFGWNVVQIDGNDMEAVLDALDKVRKVKGKPSVILADTVKGKGVSFMEDQVQWHSKAPNEEEAARAIKEIMEGEKA
ncbi:MAG: transketolase [Lachnospiraceae bacterium]|nr:transketolase [Lachnospiraceae bacterium]